ncbi:MAG: manganese efflux pump MntP family protein, partial [Raoultibacter sp.]
MGFIEVFLIGVGLSMDAFAVAICKGLGMARLNVRHAVIIALFFGIFQAVMPLIGFALGTQFESFISGFDHWIAFVLSAGIGAKMLWDAFGNGGCGCADGACELGDPAAADVAAATTSKLDYKELLMLALATSIDALAVGITFAFLQVNIVFAVVVIGVTTFVLSLAGVYLGHTFGARYEKPATIAGGIVLIAIGCKILLEHLGFLG